MFTGGLAQLTMYVTVCHGVSFLLYFSAVLLCTFVFLYLSMVNAFLL